MLRKIEMRPESFVPVHTTADIVTLEGETVLRVTKAEKINDYDTNTYARAVGTDFHNGTIEVDMKSRLLPDAPDLARGFIGIVFRAKEDDSEFESFYVRPTNSVHATEDPVRRSHGCQYFSFPGYTFAYFREFGIGGYEAPIAYGLDEWIHLKAVVRNDRAEFYLNYADEPVLAVEPMKHGKDAHGALGLFVDIGTEAFFKNLTVEETE